jgi:hypothetical protein
VVAPVKDDILSVPKSLCQDRLIGSSCGTKFNRESACWNICLVKNLAQAHVIVLDSTIVSVSNSIAIHPVAGRRVVAEVTLEVATCEPRQNSV